MDKCKVNGCNKWIQKKGYCYTHLKERLPDVVKKIDSDYSKWFQRRYHSDEEYKSDYNDRQRKKYRTYREKYLQNKREYFQKLRPLERQKVLNHYGMKCMCNGCSVTEEDFLTIDHINNDGAEHKRLIKRRRLYAWLIINNFPKGFQVLCYNCNCSKGKHGYCLPHK